MPKEALLRREFYMLWVSRFKTQTHKHTRSQEETIKAFPMVLLVTSFPQVLCQHDHPVSGWVLQSFWPKFHRGRSLSLFCWSRQQRLQLHWKALLWNPHGQVLSSNMHLHTFIFSLIYSILCSQTFSIFRTSYRTAMGVEMVLLTILVSTLSTTSVLGKVKDNICL